MKKIIEKVSHIQKLVNALQGSYDGAIKNGENLKTEDINIAFKLITSELNNLQKMLY